MAAVSELPEEMHFLSKAQKERNCVDVMQKLVELDLVKVIPTVGGNEWLTPEQLDREIREAMLANGGRISIVDLPLELGVSMEHCEARANLICKGGIKRLHGELISDQYVQGVAEEIEEVLRGAGFVQLSDLATRYNLPAEFMRENVLGRISCAHVLKQNAIYTAAHEARGEARVRGALRGITQPTSLAQLASRLGLESDMVSTAVQKLLRSDVVRGKLQGATFTPKGFAEAQTTQVNSVFDANAYLPLSLAKSAGISVKDWAQDRGIQGGVSLSTVFVAPQMVDSALSSISEALAAESWLDVQSTLPPALMDADAKDLVQHLVSKKKLPATAIIIDRVVMSKAFVKSIAGRFDAEVNAAAERSLTAGPAKAAKKATAPVDDDDDGGSSKKKGKRAAKGKKGKADDDDGDEAAGGAGSADSGVDNQAIMDLLMDQLPEVPADIYDELCSQVQPLLAALIAEAAAVLRSTLQSKQKQQFEQVEKLVQGQYEKLVLGQRALEALKLSESPLAQHLQRETVAEPLHAMLAYRWHEASGQSMEVTASTRKQCLEKIKQKEGAPKVESLSKLIAALGKDAKGAPKDGKEAAKGDKDSKADKEAGLAADIAELYHAAADDCHVFCRRVDKKREKAVLQEQRAECRERLKVLPVSDAALLCTVGLQISVLQDGVPGLLFPNELWASRMVAQSLADEALRNDAGGLCDLVEGGDAVALEAAAAAWKERFLSAAK